MPNFRLSSQSHFMSSKKFNFRHKDVKSDATNNLEPEAPEANIRQSPQEDFPITNVVVEEPIEQQQRPEIQEKKLENEQRGAL